MIGSFLDALVTIAVVFFVSISAQLSTVEIQALKNLFDFTNGPNWKIPVNKQLNAWNFSFNPQPCTQKWYGVTCSATCNTVTKANCSLIGLNLANLALHGSVPGNLADLNKLGKLDLSSNSLSGNIPNLPTSLLSISFDSNKMVGNLPDSLFLCTRLSELTVSNNLFSGTVSSKVGYLTALTNLVLRNNFFSGSLPEELGQLPLLTSFSAKVNQLKGPIPASLFSNKLQYLQIGNNFLTGKIPDEMWSLTSLTYISIHHNFISGTIPTVVGTLKKLALLSANNVKLRGRIPTELGVLSLLNTLELGSGMNPYMDQLVVNQLTGTIPTELSALSLLTTLNLQYNRLHGTIPKLGTLSNLNYLYLGGNSLSGTVPSFFSSMPLNIFFIDNNELSGNLDEVFNSTTQRNLQNVDISGNFFTGALPTEVFQSKGAMKLISFAAAKNCFHGQLTEAICTATYLQVLSLDGFSSNSNCVRHKQKKTDLIDPVSPVVPACLWTLTSLGTLHLSAILYSGPFPTASSDSPPTGASGAKPLQPALRNLSLAHNRMSGTVPDFIFSHSWLQLDISFNKLTGLLSPNISIAPNGLANFVVNRLSGAIPDSWLGAPVRVLEGNMFSCESALPLSDPSRRNYNCGWLAFEKPQLSWIVGLFFLSFLLWGILRGLPVLRAAQTRLLHNFSEMYVSSPDVKWSTELFPLRVMAERMSSLRRLGLLITAVAVCCLLPVYFTLDKYYRSYTHTTAWALSAAFKTGKSAAFILLSVLTLFLILFLHLMSRRGNVTSTLSVTAIEDSSIKDRNNKKISRNNLILAGSFILITVFYLALVLCANILYVYYERDLSITALVVTQISLSAFKILCFVLARTAVEYLRPLYFRPIDEDSCSLEEIDLKARTDAWEVTLLSFLGMMSHIIVPCIAMMYADPKCLRYFFNALPPIQSTYTYQSCTSKWNGIGAYNPLGCVAFSTIVRTIQFDPPFQYSDECSSSLVRLYASVFGYYYLLSGVIRPLVILCAAMAIEVLEAPSIFMSERNFKIAHFHNLGPTDIAGEELAYVSAKYISQKVGVELPQGSVKYSTQRTGEELSEGSEEHTPRKTCDDFFRSCLLRLLHQLLKSSFPHRLGHDAPEIFGPTLATSFGVLCSFGIAFPPIAVMGCVHLWVETYLIQWVIIYSLEKCPGEEARFKLRQAINHKCLCASLVIEESMRLMPIFCGGYFALFVFNVLADQVGVSEAYWVFVFLPSLPAAFLLWEFTMCRWGIVIHHTVTLAEEPIADITSPPSSQYSTAAPFTTTILYARMRELQNSGADENGRGERGGEEEAYDSDFDYNDNSPEGLELPNIHLGGEMKSVTECGGVDGVTAHMNPHSVSGSELDGVIVVADGQGGSQEVSHI